MFFKYSDEEEHPEKNNKYVNFLCNSHTVIHILLYLIIFFEFLNQIKLFQFIMIITWHSSGTNVRFVTCNSNKYSISDRKALLLFAFVKRGQPVII